MDLMTYLLATKNGGGGSGLPEVTSADNGKILKVKDGEWGTGEDISGDKLPPVSSTDNGKVLKVVDAEWNIGEDEGGIEAVELTQGQYNELSTAEKEDPTKVYFINTGTPTLDPQYAYHTNQDETLIYRCKADDGSEGMWFLNGFEVTSLTNTAIPTELRQYAPGGNGKVSDAWADTNGTPFLVGGKQCYAGIYNNTVRIWSNNGTTNQLGTVYAVIDMRLDNRQYNEWSDPYIYTTNRNHKIYYKDIKYSVSIPDSTIFNNGKILRIVNGAWSIDDETTELPEVTGSDNGKILKVTEGQWAKGDAPESIQVGNATGDIVSFNDGADNILMPKLIASIEPQQDLHGYDSPWVGGAGKNKLPLTVDGIKSANGGSSSWSGNATTINGVTFTILTDSDNNVTGIKVNGTASINTGLKLVDTITNITPYDNCIINGCPSGGSTSKYRIGVASYDSSSAFVKDYNDLGSGVTLTFSQDNVSKFYVSITIYQGYNAQNLVFKPMIRLASVTDSTFAPYSNECPISGWTACNVVRTGKNLFDINSCESGYLNENGVFVPYSGFYCTPYLNIKPNITYSLAYNRINTSGGGGMRIAWYDKNKTFIRRDGDIESTTIGEKIITATAPSNAYYCRCSLVDSQEKYILTIGTITDLSSYTPYDDNSHTYTINFVDGSSPLTVYGGKLDVVSGGLDDIQKSFTLDGTETISMGTSGGKTYFTASISSKIGGYSYNTSPTNKDLFISSHFKGDNSINYGNFYITGGGGTIVFLVEGITSKSAMTTWLTNNTPQFVVPLATPQTYQLTPTEVKSLLEKNVIYADAGKVTVTYYKHSEALEDMDILFSKLPNVNTTDDGKVLKVTNGAWDKGDSDAYVALTQAQYDALPSSKLTDGKMYCITDQDARELPEVTASDNGKILKVDNGAWTKGDAPTELPATTSADEGKVLKVGSNGNWEKATDTAATTVKQSPTITNADYEILFSGTADNTEHAEIVRKTTGFIFNPNIRTAFIGIKATGDWIPGSYSFGTGYFIKISGDYSHAEGYQTIASGNYSHAEGNSVTASGNHSHAEGFHTTVDGDFSHGEGYYTTASGAYGSHAEGYHTIASGNYSHAEGQYTTANHKSQHTFGEFNILDDSQAASTARGNYIEIVGNGNADVRSNARTLDWSGNEWIAGTYTNGSSRKIKTNIESLTNTEALKILDLNPVKFDFIKTGTNDQRERGFIAEEVMNVIPQIAFEEETDNEGNITKPASLNYIGLIPYLVKMIQIQQQEIDELKEQINN